MPDTRRTAQRAGRKPPGPMGIILTAGMPRSGSTWQFNATRLLVEDSAVRHWAGWVGDFSAEIRAPVRLVKVHNPADFQRRAHVVLTTRRPFADCLGSLIRMGWLAPDRAAVRKAYHRQRALYHGWAARGVHHETLYDDLKTDPEAAVAAIDRVLINRLSIPASAGRAARVAERLTALKPPPEPGIDDDGTVESRAKRHDSRTLLHPGHIATDQDKLPDLAQIKSWIADLP